MGRQSKKAAAPAVKAKKVAKKIVKSKKQAPKQLPAKIKRTRTMEETLRDAVAYIGDGITQYRSLREAKEKNKLIQTKPA